MDPDEQRDRDRRLELLNALLVALDRRQEVSDVVWASENSDDAAQRLQELLGVSSVTAVEILNLQWRRFARNGRQTLHDEVSALRDRR